MSTPIWVSDPGKRVDNAYALGTFSSQREPTDVGGAGAAGASSVKKKRAMNHIVYVE
jgi:hypothetical protein